MWTDEMNADLLRFIDEYRWEPRITTKLLNRRYGTSFTASKVQSHYWDLIKRAKFGDQIGSEPMAHFDEEKDPKFKTIIYWF